MSDRSAPSPPPRLSARACAVVVLAALAVVAISPTDAANAHPFLFLGLVVSVLLLDLIRLDVFERGNVSPAAVPIVALAIFFGPVGPVAAEALIALSRAVQHKDRRGWLADFGMLSLAGTAAAVAYDLAAPTGDGGVLVGALAAGLAEYFVNALLLVTLMAVSFRTSPLAAWREGWAWLWPHYLAFGALAGVLVLAERRIGGLVLLAFGVPVFMLWLAERQYLSRSRASVTELRSKHDELHRANERLRTLLADKQDLMERMNRSYLSTITSLARTIEAKDPYTGDHTERVADIAVELAAELGLGRDELAAVRVGAVIHDIGKIGIPDRVLLKPGALEAAERDEIERHPEISSYILAELELPDAVTQICRSHHERYDGAGYPDGLAGEEIPLAARILTVADALDAMTSDRPYRRAMPSAAALAEIDAQSGSQFCPIVVAALHACVERDDRLVGRLRAPAASPVAAER
jgi:putative nucleotidyltransferase with HDIG domain